MDGGARDVAHVDGEHQRAEGLPVGAEEREWEDVRAHLREERVGEAEVGCERPAEERRVD